MDYIIFIAERNGTNIRHYGRIDNVRNIEEAKRKIRNMPQLKGGVFFLVSTNNMIQVNA